LCGKATRADGVERLGSRRRLVGVCILLWRDVLPSGGRGGVGPTSWWATAAPHFSEPLRSTNAHLPLPLRATGAYDSHAPNKVIGAAAARLERRQTRFPILGYPYLPCSVLKQYKKNIFGKLATNKGESFTLFFISVANILSKVPNCLAKVTRLGQGGAPGLGLSPWLGEVEGCGSRTPSQRSTVKARPPKAARSKAAAGSSTCLLPRRETAPMAAPAGC